LKNLQKTERRKRKGQKKSPLRAALHLSIGVPMQGEKGELNLTVRRGKKKGEETKREKLLSKIGGMALLSWGRCRDVKKGARIARDPVRGTPGVRATGKGSS